MARRISAETALVLKAFLAEPEREQYGLQVLRKSGIKSGSLYPILIRLEERDVLESRLADDADHPARGRPRRFYRLSSDGVRTANELLDAWQREERRRAAATRSARPRLT